MTSDTTPDITPKHAAPAELLPLNVRRGLYLLSIAALVAGPLLAVTQPEYGTAIVGAGNMLGAIALGTALANPSR